MTAGAYTGDGINYAYMGVPNGNYLNGVSWIRSAQPDLISANILSGKSIFGISGSAKSANVISGPASLTTGSTSSTGFTIPSSLYAGKKMIYWLAYYYPDYPGGMYISKLNQYATLGVDPDSSRGYMSFSSTPNYTCNIWNNTKYSTITVNYILYYEN